MLKYSVKLDLDALQEAHLNHCVMKVTIKVDPLVLVVRLDLIAWEELMQVILICF